MEKFVSVKEAVEQLGISEVQVRRLVRNGTLRILRVGYHIIIPQSELKKLQPVGEK